jgi:hypothetical protein
MVLADETAQGFYLYLDRPTWFINHFQSIFDDHRALTGGVIFLYRSFEDNNVQGCIYVELAPKHRSYNEQVPIFGWLQADSEAIALELLAYAEEYVSENGFTELRGPINSPGIYGGWGARYAGPEIPLSVDFSANQKELKNWIEQAGFQPEAEYIDVQATTEYKVKCPVQNIAIEKIQWPLKDVLGNPEIMSQLYDFVNRNFVGRLPDTTPGKMTALFQLLATVDHGEDFYIFAREKATGKIIAAILEIPNIFDQWQGNPITSSAINTAIVDKSYRGKDLFHWIYWEFQKGLNRRGITRHFGANIWSKNKAAIKSFGKASKIIGKSLMFQKSV